MDNLSLEQKIAQMFILGIDGSSLEENKLLQESIKAGLLGGVILFDENLEIPGKVKNIESPKQLKIFLSQLQELNLKHNKLPLFLSIDYEGGGVNRLPLSLGFVDTISAKEFASLPLSEKKIFAKSMAQQLKDIGFNFNFAPVVDLELNKDSKVLSKKQRSYSNDAGTATQNAKLFIDAMLEHNILTSLKHFPGHGSSKDDSHLGFVDVSDTWSKKELAPFKDLIAHCGDKLTVMIGHIINSQLDSSKLPATLSKTMLTNNLRQELNFNGLIVSDDMQMQAIADNYSIEDALVKGINAGIDLFIFGNQLPGIKYTSIELINIVKATIDSKKINISQIEESFLRIKNRKKKLLT